MHGVVDVAVVATHLANQRAAIGLTTGTKKCTFNAAVESQFETCIVYSVIVTEIVFGQWRAFITLPLQTNVTGATATPTPGTDF
jgi:hypothetical protein